MAMKGALSRRSSSSISISELWNSWRRRNQRPAAASWQSSRCFAAAPSESSETPPPPMTPPPPINPPDAENPDPATLQEQWAYATRLYSRWYSQAWGAVILAGLTFFGLGWYIKGENPLLSIKRGENPLVNIEEEEGKEGLQQSS